MESSTINEYLYNSRWCSFKEDIRKGAIEDIKFDALPFDKGKKYFVLGTAKIKDNKEKFFCMPLAKKPLEEQTAESLTDKRYIYTDALKEPDFWQSFNEFIQENNGEIVFPNGLKLQKKTIAEEFSEIENTVADSKPLGVEQSNTTLNVGNGKYAFKLERMPEFSGDINSEFEMNAKLMRENSDVMPKTYGGYVWIKPDGQQAPAGIVQEFVPNRGDLWNVMQDYLKRELLTNYMRGITLEPERHPEFMQLIQKLGEKNVQMEKSFSGPDVDGAFAPEKVDDKFIRNYEKQFKVLLYQAKHSIEGNIDRLPLQSRKDAENLLENWDEVTGAFLQDKISQIHKAEDKGRINRVHGDFHLGQVMVTQDNDLKIVDFAGEPDLSQQERRQKYIYVRDTAGMYRSINGYLGAVAVEEFSASAPDKQTALSRKEWAEKAIKPLINKASSTFLNGRSLNEPWLALEVLRKNLYEVNYEFNNRPSMAYVPIRGLKNMLRLPDTGSKIKTMENTGRE